MSDYFSTNFSYDKIASHFILYIHNTITFLCKTEWFVLCPRSTLATSSLQLFFFSLIYNCFIKLIHKIISRIIKSKISKILDDFVMLQGYNAMVRVFFTNPKKKLCHGAYTNQYLVHAKSWYYKEMNQFSTRDFDL